MSSLMSSPTSKLEREVESIEFAQVIHHRIMEDRIHDDEHYVMVWSAALVQQLIDDGWIFYRK